MFFLLFVGLAATWGTKVIFYRRCNNGGRDSAVPYGRVSGEKSYKSNWRCRYIGRCTRHPQGLGRKKTVHSGYSHCLNGGGFYPSSYRIRKVKRKAPNFSAEWNRWKKSWKSRKCPKVKYCARLGRIPVCTRWTKPKVSQKCLALVTFCLAKRKKCYGRHRKPCNRRYKCVNKNARGMCNVNMKCAYFSKCAYKGKCRTIDRQCWKKHGFGKYRRSARCKQYRPCTKYRRCVKLRPCVRKKPCNTVRNHWCTKKKMCRQRVKCDPKKMSWSHKTIEKMCAKKKKICVKKPRCKHYGRKKWGCVRWRKKRQCKN